LWKTAHSGNINNTKTLRNYLFNGYDKYAIPSDTQGEPVEVLLTNKVRRLIKVNELDQTIELFWWLRKTWRDAQLKWDPAQFGGLDSIRIISDEIWIPDTTIYNSKFPFEESAKSFQDVSVLVTISSDGTVLWLAPMTTTTTCILELASYPYDTQTCTVTFGSWSASGAVINFTLAENPNVLSEYQENNQWTMIDSSVLRTAVVYSCCPYPYIDITYTFKMQRMKEYPTFNFIVPSILLAFLVVFVFVIPPESGERASFGITIMLSITLFQQIAASSITPSQVPLLSKFYFATLIISTLSLIFSSIILRIYYHSAKPMPARVRWLLKSWFGQLILLRLCKTKEESSLEIGKQNLGLNVVAPADVNHEKKEDSEENEKQEQNLWKRGSQRTEDQLNKKSVLPEIKSSSKTTPFSVEVQKAHRQEEIRKEWVDLVLFMDRMSMILLLAVLFACIIWFFSTQ
jgi:cation transporter family protein